MTTFATNANAELPRAMTTADGAGLNTDGL